MDRYWDIVAGVFTALTWFVIWWVLLMPAIGGHPSLQQIAAPCRDHHGVAQYLPETRLFTREPATVICKDGKVGRVDG